MEHKAGKMNPVDPLSKLYENETATHLLIEEGKRVCYSLCAVTYAQALYEFEPTLLNKIREASKLINTCSTRIIEPSPPKNPQVIGHYMD